MQIVQYIPLDSALVNVYSLVDENLLEYDTVLEWASVAMSKLHVHHTYETAVTFHQIVNHSFRLACGTRYIQQIFYKQSLDANDVKVINLQIGDGKTKTWEFVKTAPGLHWLPLRAATSAFHEAIHCQGSPSFYDRCEHQYSVQKDFTVKTSVQSGYSAVAFLRYPMDSDGNFLIPDDPDVLDAIKNYILMNHWEARWQAMQEGAERRYVHYLRMWQTFAAKSRGKLLLPSIDELENLHQMMMRLGPHTNSYYSAFGNLSAGENLDLASIRSSNLNSNVTRQVPFNLND